MRLLLPLLLVTLTASLLPAADPNGGKAAMEMLPARYRNSILKLSADNGTPNPPQWSILAQRGSSDTAATYNITVAQGQIVSEKPWLDLRALFNNSVPIDLSKVVVDSDGAWAAAQRYASTKGRTLGSVSYALQQQGRDAAPVWSVWCYDPSVSYIGLIKVLATDGSVISSE